MAQIYVGSARRDENGNYVNGAVGDQLQKVSGNDMTGEVSMQTMYSHSKGWWILRLKSIEHAKANAERMQTACNNKNIGYDQNGRYGINTYGINTKTKTECDCSTLVRQCVKEATGKDPGNFTTSNEADKLEATGLFEKRIKYVSQDKTPVYDGDVLVTCSKGHTVIVVSGNPRKNTRSYLMKGDKGSEVKEMQKNLMTIGYSCGKYGADGSFGGDSDKAVRAFQEDYGLEVDGFYGTASKKKMNEILTIMKGNTKKYSYDGLYYALVFDPVYYANNYKDLKAAFGNNATALFNHFITYGMNEGRQAISYFNVKIYKERYSDLRNAFKNSLPAYYRHYIQYGRKEGRNAI